MKQIPNLFTLLNLFFGCCAIALTGRLWLTALFIGLAAVVDFLDGFVARLFKASSELGKQLDSLADVVSFGVAPSMIIYQFLQLSYSKSTGSFDLPWLVLAPAFLFACASAYRLGKFNIDTSQQYHFKGIPTPMAGMLVASFPMIYWDAGNNSIRNLLENNWFWYGIIIVISLLMVSNLPMISLKIRKGKMQQNLPHLILLLIGILAAFFLQWLAVPLVFIAYIAVSLAFKNKIS